MRKDLINAKEYKVGVKFIGEQFYIFENYNSLDEALTKFNDYKNRGFNVIIKGIH